MFDRLDAAMKRYFEETAPKNNADSRAAMSQVGEAIEKEGKWVEENEWRIMTWATTTIERVRVGERDMLQVTVECDGQVLRCRCPTLEKAYVFFRFYKQLIVDQFYSVGPPWAG